MTKRFLLLPWALLCLAIVAALALTRTTPSSTASSTASSEDSFPPPPPGPTIRPGPHAAGSAPAGSSGPTSPEMTEVERRDSHIHIAHEECEEGAKRFNVMSGRDPTDPKAIHLIGVCLGSGNVAWYKCMLRASNQEQAITCNRRFLSGGS